MKLLKKITAVLAAFAIMFTLTDTAMLGELISNAGSAFAADIIPISEITLESVPASPEAGKSFWGASAVKTNRENAIRERTVTWYLDDGSNTVVTGNAGYNKKYRVEISFRIDTTNYSVENNAKVYYYVGTTPYGMTTRTEGGQYIIAEMTFDATRLPNTVSAEFVATTSIPEGSKEITIDPFPCHTTDAEILRALPDTALVRTEDSTYSFESKITWKTALNTFDYATSSTYNPNDVSEQSFKIRGTLSVPAGTLVEDTTTQYNVFVNIRVLAADQLAKPTATTAEGEYRTGLTVRLSSSESIYYTISENDNGPDPQGGVETATNFKYNGGINLAGVVGTTKTYYIKAVAYNERFNTSDVALFKYSITLEPSNLTNIPEVHLEIEAPVGGETFNTVATLVTPSSDPERYGIALVSAVAWIGSNSNGKADYNTSYSVSVQLTAKNMYAFFSTQAYVNGNSARCMTNSTGTLTVTYTFPGRTEKLEDYTIIEPKAVYAMNGTSITDIGKLLPALVSVEAPTGTPLEDGCPVTWDLTSANDVYNPKMGKAQQFKLKGKVTLPDYIDTTVKGDTVEIVVNVGEAGTVTQPWADPLDSTEGKVAFYEETKVYLKAVPEYATIYYTIGNNSNIAAPTATGGTAFSSSAPIVLSGIPGETVDYYIKAIATAPGMKESSVSTFVYTVKIPKLTAEKPTANIASGTYQYALNVSLNTTSVGADVYYSMDPSAKKESYTKYTGVLTLNTDPNTSKTFRIYCYAKDTTGRMYDSDVVSYTYTINIPKNKVLAPYPSKNAGTYEDTVRLTLSCDTKNAEIYYTLDSTIPVSRYTKYTANTVITLKKDKYESVAYVIYTYAKSTDPNVDDSPVAQYKYTVGVDYGVKSIELEKRPLKYSYYLGELINVTGGQIKVTYEDGKTESILIDEDMIEEFDSWVLGQQTVIVNFHGATTSFNIVVRKKDDGSSTDTSKDDTKKDDTKKDDTTTSDDTTKDDAATTDDTTVSPPTMKGSSVKGWDQLLLKVKAAKAESRIVINLNGNTSVPADIINAATAKKATVEFVVNDMLSWVVDAGTLKKTVGSVSVGIKSTDVYIPSVLIDTAGESEVVRVHTYGENKIGAVLYVKTGCKEKNRFVNMFVYNEDTHLLDFVSTSKVSASTGVAQAVPTRSGDYVIMLDSKTRLPGDADNSTRIDAKDASAILKMCVGKYEFDDTCDFNGDGFVNALDSSAILKSIVGLL